MKCPYCDQEHPDGTTICPVTGKLLEGSAPVEPPQESQPAVPAEVVEAAQVVQAPVLQEDLAPELPTIQASTAGASQPEQELPPTAPEAQAIAAAPAEPGPPPMEEISAVPPVEALPPMRKHTTRWIIGGCVGIPLLILLLLAIIVFADPFKLHIVGRIDGSYDAAAEVMPADTGFYLGINIANGVLTNADRIIIPFMPGEQEVRSSPSLGFSPSLINSNRLQQAGPFDELLSQIEDETGIKIPEDISPWVGQYAGAGAVEFKDTGYGMMAPTGFLIAAEARSLSRADAFLAKLASNMKELQGTEFDLQTYKRVTIYVEKTFGSEGGISFGRSGRMLLLATSPDILKQAIDRQADQALSQEKDYTSLMDIRPRDWSASLYFNHQWIDAMMEDLMTGDLSPALPLVNPYSSMNWTGMLVNVSAIKQGARVDMYMDFDESAMAVTSNEQLMSSLKSPDQVIRILPQDTLVYLASSRFDLLLDSMLTQALPDEADENAFFDTFELLLGFSIHDDLLNHLNGQWALYAVPSTRGLFPEQLNLNLAVNLLVQSDSNLDLQGIASKLTMKGPMMGLMVNSQAQGGINYYEITSQGDEIPALAFGSGNGYFTLGTDLEALQVSTIEDNMLVNSANYLTAVKALPSGVQPTMYVDLESLFANLREGMEESERQDFNESINAIAPIRIIALGSRLLQDGIAHSSLVIVIDND